MCVCVSDGENTKVLVLYPEHGVTRLQKMQLLSSCSENVSIAGEFCIMTLCLLLFLLCLSGCQKLIISSLHHILHSLEGGLGRG